MVAPAQAPPPLSDDEAARVRRWALRQGLLWLVVGGAAAGLAGWNGGWIGWVIIAAGALLVTRALGRWRRLRALAAGAPAVLLEGSWRVRGGRNSYAMLGDALIGGVVATTAGPAQHARVAARAVPLDALSWFTTTQSYLVVEWLPAETAREPAPRGQ